MRALEISIFLIMVLTAPSLVYAMGVIPVEQQVCTSLDCQARETIYDMASNFELKQIDMDASPGQIAWDVITLTITFPVFALFWMLYFLSLVVLIGPALVSMFHIPQIMATYLNIGVWILWLIAYVQWKRGGLGTDAHR